MDNAEHRARAKAALERFISRPKARPRPYPGYSKALLRNHTPEETFEIIAEDGKLPFEPEPENTDLKASDLVRVLLESKPSRGDR